MTARFERDTLQGELFMGHEPSECGEHRTVGAHRAWCFQCTTWCYPGDACPGCKVPALEAAAEAVTTCGNCYAQVREEYLSEHSQWHSDLQDVISGALRG